LVNMEGCISIQNQTQLNEAFDLLLHNEDERLEKGHVCSTFVQMNKGATQTIMNHILNETLN
jgi:3-deoxy-D-manno-octulosonic-acid transferase